MAKTKTRPYDAAEYLETEDDMAAYLQAALEDGDPALVIHALGNIAHARGMSQIARQTGSAARTFTRRCRPKGIRSLPRFSRWSRRWASNSVPTQHILDSLTPASQRRSAGDAIRSVIFSASN